MRLSRYHCAAVAALCLFNVAPAANANTVVTLTSVTPAAGGTRFTYNFAFVATPGTVTLESRDFFTIYGFVALVGYLGKRSSPGSRTEKLGLDVTVTNTAGTTAKTTISATK